MARAHTHTRTHGHTHTRTHTHSHTHAHTRAQTESHERTKRRFLRSADPDDRYGHDGISLSGALSFWRMHTYVSLSLHYTVGGAHGFGGGRRDRFDLLDRDLTASMPLRPARAHTHWIATYKYIGVCMNVHLYMCACVSTRKHIFIHFCIYTSTYPCIIHIYIYISVSTYRLVRALYIYIYIHFCIYISTYLCLSLACIHPTHPLFRRVRSAERR
jgi:hypothetical protein